MKLNFIIIILIFPLIVIGQNPNDSLLVITKSDNLVEIIKPLIPEIKKISRKDIVLDGVYIDDKIYPILKNGEIKIYNRFYQLMERFVYKDSSLILKEDFNNERKVSQIQFISNDSIYTYYFSNGNIRNQDHITPTKKTFTYWYENGVIESICEQIGAEQKCEYWDKEGYYTHGKLQLFKNRELLTEFELDRSGKKVKQTK